MKNEEIKRKVIEILTDYKFNENQIFTTKQQADKIIDLIEQAEEKRILELIDEKIKFQRLVNTHISKQIIKVLKKLKREVEK